MGWLKKKKDDDASSYGTLPKGYKPPKRKNHEPAKKANYVERTYYSQYSPPPETPSYSSEEYNSPHYSKSVNSISDVITLLEGLRAKYREELMWSSDANSLRHRKIQAHEDSNAIDAYISMCKGAFEKNKSHFQDALRFLKLGRESIQSSAYPLILLCQAYLAHDDSERKRNLNAAKRASYSMQEELAREIFELVVDEMEIDSFNRVKKGGRIRELVEEKQDNDEDRYVPIYDEEKFERAKERYRTFLEKAVERRERTFYALMDSLKSRKPYG